MLADVQTRDAYARAYVYRFLASVFTAHPTAQMVTGLAEMAEFFGIPCPQDASLEELDQEYMDLFVVPNRRYVAPQKVSPGTSVEVDRAVEGEDRRT
ncbi:MAG: hypothetical protein HYX92_01680 [Chloroflexi bacterium]|nr:hypothetical protein [Chloroflexota bacterium]